MPELNFSAADSFKEAVKNGAEEAASAFARTFSTGITLEPRGSKALSVEKLSAALKGQKGLALVLTVGKQGIAIFIPSSTGLVPVWCEEPDATGKSKLSTFAQEWGMNLVPEDFFPEEFKAAVVHDLAGALRRALPELDAGELDLGITKVDGTVVDAYIVWGLSSPDELLNEPKPETSDALPPALAVPPLFSNTGAGGADPFAEQNFGSSGMPNRKRLEDLPGYSRSMLKVKIPVAAVLARARKPIKLVLGLGVGSIIQFDKSPEELLDVEVGQTITIATAEGVKVGDRLGFRINTVQLPEERFRRVEVRREGDYRSKNEEQQIIGKNPIRSFNR